MTTIGEEHFTANLDKVPKSIIQGTPDLPQSLLGHYPTFHTPDPHTSYTPSQVPFEHTKQHYPIIDAKGSHVHPEMQAKIGKGFFKNEQDWTCYRRNYFSVACWYDLTLGVTPASEPLYLKRTTMTSPDLIQSWAMSITARAGGEDGKIIELVQHTPKRDKGPLGHPEKIKLLPLKAPSPSNQQSSLTVASFDRIQFKNATANNGKRLQAQQYFHVVVELLAEISGSKALENQYVVVASRLSAPLVVRGRSPGHYCVERNTLTEEESSDAGSDSEQSTVLTSESSGDDETLHQGFRDDQDSDHRGSGSSALRKIAPEDRSSSEDGQEWLHFRRLGGNGPVSEESSTSLSPPRSLPPDLNVDEDLLNPSAWIDRINDVEAEVVEQSALRLLVARQEDIKMQELPSIHSRPRINVPASTRWYEGNELFNQEILERSTSADEIHIGGEQEDREDKSRRENLIQETIDILKSWFEEHITHPYPTKEESEIIMDRTVLTRGLLSDWFSNARRRHPHLNQGRRYSHLNQGRRHPHQNQGRRHPQALMQVEGINIGGRPHKSRQESLEAAVSRWMSLETTDIPILCRLYADTELNDFDQSLLNGPEPYLKTGEHNLNEFLQLRYDLQESCFIMARVCCNVSILQKEGICQNGISLIALYHLRPEVASLQFLKVPQITKLASLFYSVYDAVSWGFDVQRIIPQVTITGNSDALLLALLGDMETIADNFADWLFGSSSTVGFQRLVSVCRVISHVLDLAVVTYCGNHLSSLDRRFFGRDIQRFEIHQPDAREKFCVIVKRRSLSCLDSFLHGKQVWVFHYGEDALKSSLEDTRLCLSTTIEAFADIWGPVWKTMSKNGDENLVLRYNVGLGVIVSWSSHSPKVLQGEVLCHWASSVDVIAETAAINVKSHPRLVIGGPGVRITANETCKSSINSLIESLQSQGCLRPCGTAKARRYKDSEGVQIQIGHFGLQVGYQATYKYRPGTTWKERIIERWKMEPDKRNPRLLEYKCGVEVSLCTLNTRRRRLLHVLASKTMRCYLSSMIFEWPDQQCENAFYNALNSEDIQAFYNLYVLRKDWRNALGLAVSWCFEELLHTGVDSSGDLQAFYSSSAFGEQEWWTTIRHKDNTWVGMLKDTEHCATMAIATESCFEFTEYPGQHCRQRPGHGDQFSIFETKLVGGCVDVLEMPGRACSSNQKLSIGPAGSLKILSRLLGGGLLVHWKDRPFYNLGRTPKMLSRVLADVEYNELMRDHFLEDAEKGIPIFVASKNVSKLRLAINIEALKKSELKEESDTIMDEQMEEYEEPNDEYDTSQHKHKSRKMNTFQQHPSSGVCPFWSTSELEAHTAHGVSVERGSHGPGLLHSYVES